MQKFKSFFWWCAGVDKAILEKCPKRGRIKNELSMAIPRIILAIIISIVIAKPLELKIFEKEISVETMLMEQEEISRKNRIL